MEHFKHALAIVPSRALIGGSLAVLLLWFSVPEIIEAARALQIESGIDLLRADAAVRDRNEAGATALERLGKRFGDSRPLLEAGSLRSSLALAAASLNRGTDLQQSRDDFRAALAVAPENPVAWAQLAAVYNELVDVPHALTAWRTSITFGRYDPAINLWRAQFGIHLWLALDARDQALVREQLAFVWGDDPATIVVIARSSNFFADIVRSTLASDAKQLSIFEHWLKPV